MAFIDKFLLEPLSGSHPGMWDVDSLS